MHTHSITVDLPMQGRRLMRARFGGGHMSSDGGALPLRAADRAIRWPAPAPSTGRSWTPPGRPPQDRYKHIVADLRRLDALLAELFQDSHAAPRGEIALDVDETNDPPHGGRKGASSTANTTATATCPCT